MYMYYRLPWRQRPGIYSSRWGHSMRTSADGERNTASYKLDCLVLSETQQTAYTYHDKWRLKHVGIDHSLLLLYRAVLGTYTHTHIRTNTHKHTTHTHTHTHMTNKAKQRIHPEQSVIEKLLLVGFEPTTHRTCTYAHTHTNMHTHTHTLYARLQSRSTNTCIMTSHLVAVPVAADGCHGDGRTTEQRVPWRWVRSWRSWWAWLVMSSVLMIHSLQPHYCYSLLRMTEATREGEEKGKGERERKGVNTV